MKPSTLFAGVSSLLTGLLAISCGHPPSHLGRHSVQSEKLGKQMPFSVLPAPKVEGRNPATLPVVIFLHGMGGDHLNFDEFGVSDAIVAAMRNGEIPASHMIFPNGERGFYLNWHDGSHPYEDYIVDEVIPTAESRLGINPTRSDRHIAGVSMGGIGALQIGLRHPERFGSVTCLSGVILNRQQALTMMRKPLFRLLLPIERIWGDGTDRAFSDSINPFALLPGDEDRPPQDIFLAYGSKERDQIRDTTRAFHEHLEQHHIRHRFTVFEGRHKWRYWIPVIKAAMAYVLTP